MSDYLALGDSYTIGEGVPAPDTWPHRLSAALSLTPPQVIAVTGWSADELLAAMAEASTQPPYRLVSVLIGVNDQYREREVDEHLPYFNTVLSRAVALADGDPGRVFVVSIPDWGVSGFGADDARDRAVIAAAIDAYNDAQQELCVARGIAHVDITALSRTCMNDPGMFVDDRLHPSSGQYRRWLDLIEPTARACLHEGVRLQSN